MFGQEIKFVICAGGIFFFYLYYGILQENVYVENSVKASSSSLSPKHRSFTFEISSSSV
jgi:hypothetical protein